MFFGIALVTLGVVVAGLLWTKRFKPSCGMCVSNSRAAGSKPGIGI